MTRAASSRPPGIAAALIACGVVFGSAPAVGASEATLALKPCRLKGVEHEAQCGVVSRLLDPNLTQGTRIDIHFAVLPALARRKAADPVLFFAGGPGQSAIDLAGPLSKRYARFANRRDLLFIDQRGTGRSAPLKCADDNERAGLRAMAEGADEAGRIQRTQDCAVALQKLPHGDLRQYTTHIASADVDAVRAALGVEQINAIGASYGTRAVLDYQRQFPQRVRRAVLDGMAPPDMVLPASFSPDNQAALDAVFAACEAEDACHRRYPALRAQWQQLLARLPLQMVVAHPMSGQIERLTLTRGLLLAAVRGPLYAPSLAAGLPAALAEAVQGRFNALVGLSQALGAGGAGMSTGMHFSVVCSEDVPRLVGAGSGGAGFGGAGSAGIDAAQGADFGASFAQIYTRICADWPRGEVPAAFYQIKPASVATLVLSGGADPATPPRHGERTVQALGPKAKHVVVAQAGHGVLGLACLREAVVRFVDAASDDEALKVDTRCADKLPRPPAFVPLQPLPAAGKGLTSTITQ